MSNIKNHLNTLACDKNGEIFELRIYFIPPVGYPHCKRLSKIQPSIRAGQIEGKKLRYQ